MKDTKLEDKIALLVDGPNMWKTDFGDIAKAAEKYGILRIREIFLTKDAPSGLVESAINSGYTPVTNCIKDIDCSLAARATEIACSPDYKDITMLALASNDGDYVPAVQLSRKYGKRVVAIGVDNGYRSLALTNAADFSEAVSERRMAFYGEPRY